MVLEWKEVGDARLKFFGVVIYYKLLQLPDVLCSFDERSSKFPLTKIAPKKSTGCLT